MIPWAVRFSLFAVLLSLACQKTDEHARCGKCGMMVDANPRWVAAVVHPDGMEKRFCSPKCMMAWIEGEKWTGPAWVTDYYTQEHIPLAEALFVEGSDVTGPMGSARVPVRGLDAARQFFEDHGGESVLRHDGTRVDVAVPVD